MNEPDLATWSRPNSTSSVINLSFVTQRLHSKISDWYIDESNASGSDHELIRFSIRTEATRLVENPIHTGYFNLNKADWKVFSEALISEAQDINFLYLSSQKELEAAAL